MNDYTFRIFTQLDETLTTQWRQLWEQAENASAFNSVAWFLVALATCTPKSYEIYTCFSGNELVAIMGVYSTRRFLVPLVSSKWYRPVNTPFLMRTYDESLFRAFFGGIRRHRSFYFPKVDAKAARLLHRLFPDMFFSLISVNPYVSREEHPEAFSSTTNHKNARKVMKKFASDLVFRTYTDADDLPSYLEILFATEQQSQKKLRGMDIFSHSQTRQFFQNIVKYAHQFVRIDFLYYKGIPISYTFNFLYKQSFMGYQTSYCAEYKHLYPGKVILVYDLESLRDTSVATVNFGGGVSSYKTEFAPSYFFLYDVYYSKHRFIMLWWRGIYTVRRLKQRLLPVKHSRDHEFLFQRL